MSLRARFHDLQSLLTRHASLWRPSPFHVARPQWCAQWPGLATALDALDDDLVERFSEDTHACAKWLASQLPELACLIDAARAMAVKAREENAALEARLAALEAKLAGDAPKAAKKKPE